MRGRYEGRLNRPFDLGDFGRAYALHIFNHGYTDGRGRYGL